MESLLSLLRMHWDHEPTPNPCQEGNGQNADRCLFPSWEGLGVGRFMESLLSLLRMHWDHEPTPNPSREGTDRTRTDACSPPGRGRGWVGSWREARQFIDPRCDDKPQRGAGWRGSVLDGSSPSSAVLRRMDPLSLSLPRAEVENAGPRKGTIPIKALISIVHFVRNDFQPTGAAGSGRHMRDPSSVALLRMVDACPTSWASSVARVLAARSRP